MPEPSQPSETVESPPSGPIVLAFSGGLDTSWSVMHLAETLGRGVVTVTIDTGGFSPEELDAIGHRAGELGALEHWSIDGQQSVFDNFARHFIAGNCLRGGVYPLCVAAERVVQVQELARIARELGASAVAHGSTGAGNDQIRFDVGLSVLAPGVEILAPVRDGAMSRADQHAFLAERGVPATADAKTYSVNRGLWGTTIGGGDLHDPTRPVPRDCWPDTVDPDKAPKKGTRVKIRYEKGVPVALDGQEMTGVALVHELRDRGSAHGIGRGLHVGDTILGIKGRLAFEAPAATVLIAAHRELEKLVLSKQQLMWKDRLGEFYGQLVHEGLYFDPVALDVESFLSSTQRHLDGTVTLRLVRGRIEMVSIDAPGSLLGRLGAVYGEGSCAWSGDEARAFSKLYGMPSVLAARRDEELRPRHQQNGET